MPGPRSSAPQELRELLKQMRLDAGMTQHGLAAAARWSQSKVGKIESGRTLRPETADIRTIAEVTRATARQLATALDLAGQAAVVSRSYSSSHARGMAARQKDIRQIEASADAIRTFQPSLVPGLLQTGEYARLDMELANVSGQADVGKAVAARQARQAALLDPSRQFDFILHEAALRWHPGGPEVMAGQADRILSAATLANVSVGVIPARQAASVLFLSGFVIYEVPGRPLVLVELLTSEDMLDDPDDVSVYQDTFARLADAALYGDQAAAVIRAAALS